MGPCHSEPSLLRLGGLGLRSAVRVAPAAYWASWADCLAMIRARHPGLANLIVQALEGDTREPCLRELQQARAQVVMEGCTSCPGWHALVPALKHAGIACGCRPACGVALVGGYAWLPVCVCACLCHSLRVAPWPRRLFGRAHKPTRAEPPAAEGPQAGTAVARVGAYR